MSKYYKKSVNRNSKFNNKNGSLTRYGFACGYIENYEKDDDNRVSLSFDCIFHIKGFLNGEHFWECLDNDQLQKARKMYISFCKKIDNLN